MSPRHLLSQEDVSGREENWSENWVEDVKQKKKSERREGGGVDGNRGSTVKA